MGLILFLFTSVECVAKCAFHLICLKYLHTCASSGRDKNYSVGNEIRGTGQVTS